MNQEDWIFADNKQLRPPSDQNFLVQMKGGDFMVVTPAIIDSPQWSNVLAWQTIQSYKPTDPVKTAEALLTDQLIRCFGNTTGPKSVAILVAQISILIKAHVK